jgi:hypothetical protein
MYNVKVIGADQVKDSGAVTKDLQAVGGPARLFSGVCYNASAGSLFLQAHDSSTTPADGAVPKLVLTVPAQQTGFFDFTDGHIFGNGIYLCLSSNDTTKTLVGSNSGIFTCTFRKTE